MQIIENSHLQEPESLGLLESEAEHLIGDFQQRFRRLGEIFLKIKNSKLYRDAGYSTFAQYMKERWGWSRGRAYQIINAALVALELEEYFSPEYLPKSEFAVRPLVSLDFDEQIDAWLTTSLNPTKEETEERRKDIKIIGVYPVIGSKWKLSKVIAERARGIDFKTYLEPFLGSGAVFFRFVSEGLIAKPGMAVLNDLNCYAMSLLKVLKEQPDKFQEQLEFIPYSRMVREEPEPPPDADDLKRAEWWTTHTYLGYVGSDTKNKGFSIDRNGKAYRHAKWNRFKQQIRPMGKILCDYAMHEKKDALEFIQQYALEGTRSLIFVDPPYIGHERDYRASFTKHTELAEILAEVPAAGIFATYYDCDELRQLYPESRWNWELFERQSTCTADGVHQPRVEVLLSRKERVSIAVAPPQQPVEPAPQEDLKIGDAATLAEEPSQTDEIEPEDKTATSVHFKSESVEHYTPQKIIDLVLEFFGVDQIDLDPCSNSKDNPNFPAQRVFTKDNDGLVQQWKAKTLFLNPPYGAEIDAWVSKLIHEYLSGDTKEAIALVPGRIDTRWFDRFYGYPACFIKGRLKFVGNETSAPFPSVLFYLGKRQDDFARHFSTVGSIWSAANPLDSTLKG